MERLGVDRVREALIYVGLTLVLFGLAIGSGVAAIAIADALGKLRQK